MAGSTSFDFLPAPLRMSRMKFRHLVSHLLPLRLFLIWSAVKFLVPHLGGGFDFLPANYMRFNLSEPQADGITDCCAFFRVALLDHIRVLPDCLSFQPSEILIIRSGTCGACNRFA
jgi:hypothetical protein